MPPANSFIKGNSLNVIGEFARVLIAPFSYPIPTKIGDIITLTGSPPSYDPVATYGFRDIGLTGAPFQMSHQADTNQWDSQQIVRFRVVPTNYFGSVSTEALEMTQQNKVTLMNASAAADPSANEHRTNFAARISFPLYRVAAVHFDEYGLLHASVFPRCQWDGGAIQQTLERGQMYRIPFSFMAWADENVIDTVTQQACFRIDFDQF